MPTDAQRRNLASSHHAEVQKLNERIALLEQQLAAAKSGLSEVEALIDCSHGVSGLHMNGDVAPWAELRTGGRFESWLLGFDAAITRTQEQT